MRQWLVIGLAIISGAVGCSSPTTSSDSGGSSNGGGTTTNCNSLTTVSPVAVGGTLLSGTTATYVQGGTYLVPSGSLRLTGTGNGNVTLSAVQGSTRSNAPFTMNFTGPGSFVFEPFQVTPQSVTMSLCNP